MLGILVGRGTSPVTFDTEKFQKRLAVIAKEYGYKKEIAKQEKVELQFYKVLAKPVQEEEPVTERSAKKGPGKTKKRSEVIPEKVVDVSDEIPVKKSRKQETFKRSVKKINSGPKISIARKEKEKVRVETKKPEPKVQKEIKKEPPEKKSVDGNYTIQIAAYKDFKDAVSHMANLEKKGFTSYRIKAQKDGQTWYRVRSGLFTTKELADRYLKKLKQAKINGMVIKRNSDDNIKG